jgi:hypothetical protein
MNAGNQLSGKRKEELPVEFRPLTHETLDEGDEFETEFRIPSSIRDKTVNLIEESDLNGITKIGFPYLMPSDMWGWARVMSKYYGRLNELILARSQWEILGKAFPEQDLYACSRIGKSFIRRKLPFVEIETITRNESRQPLLRSKDTVLLLHGLEEKVHDGNSVETEIPDTPLVRVDKVVYFRHEWNKDKWRNNIHTADYARRFGFKEELPEFITYMDAITMALINLNGEAIFTGGTKIDLKRVLPLYRGDAISIYVEHDKRENSYLVRAFLKETSDERFRAVCTTPYTPD